jgi:hypothetical protein
VRSWIEEAMVGSMSAWTRVGWKGGDGWCPGQGGYCGYIRGCSLAARCSFKAVVISGLFRMDR